MTSNANIRKVQGTEGSSPAARPSTGSRTGPVQRTPFRTEWLRWLSIAVIAASFITLGFVLPVGKLAGVLRDWVGAAGPWGPLLFGAVYVLAALLFVPGLALTLAAGAAFGLLIGTATVSVASTFTAALAFLIARYVARDSVERVASRYRQFSAVDAAVSEGGWRVVALLRLSPLVPFSAGNYLFGLTGVRFWPYVLSSWVAMLPGTVMYVYVGYLGYTGVAATAGSRERRPAEWVLLAMGLAATVAVTWYLTRLARWKLQQDTSQADKQDLTQPSPSSASEENGVPAGGGVRKADIALAIGAVVLAVVAGCAVAQRDAINRLFGPPAVTLQEAYEQRPGGPTVDHSTFDSLLRSHVTKDGWVDFTALKGDPTALDGYVRQLAVVPFEQLGRDEKLALLMNAYNAFTLRLILDYWDGGKLKSIQDIPSERRWEDQRWSIGGNTWTLNQIEHEQIRPMFREPRIHFALVCAAIGCPPLRPEAYNAAKIEEQLADQARYVHSHDRWFQFDPKSNVVHLTKLYDWYGDDFKQVAGSVLEYAAKYSIDLQKALDEQRKLSIKWLEYDWRLNSAENKP